MKSPIRIETVNAAIFSNLVKGLLLRILAWIRKPLATNTRTEIKWGCIAMAIATVLTLLPFIAVIAGTLAFVEKLRG